MEMVIPILVNANNTTIETSSAQVGMGKVEKPKIENTRIPTGKYDELGILWANRPYIPNQNKDEFLSEHASGTSQK